jgi:hypothetical protein
VDSASGAWEVNYGTYTSSGTTLSRNATPLSSSAGGALVNFTGAVDVFVTYPSSNAVWQDISGVVAQQSFGAITATSAALTTGTITTAPASSTDIVNKQYADATVPVARGGTGATTEANARTNLGATTLGANVFTITNPSAVTFPRFNADNTVSSLDAASFRTAIGAGTGAGSVTSVAATVPTFLSVAGSPITTSGTLAITLSGTALPVANGGTGATTLTANNVLLGNGTSALQVVAPGTNGNVLTSNGTTWTSAAAGGASALVLLSTVTASGSATVDVETGFSSTYDDYMITVSGVISSTGSSTLLGRLKLGGAYNTTGLYYWNTDTRATNSALNVPEFAGGDTSFQLCAASGLGSSLGDNFSMSMFLLAVNNSGTKAIYTNGAYALNNNKGGGTLGYANSNNVISGVRFFASAGNLTGTFKLYGIAK